MFKKIKKWINEHYDMAALICALLIPILIGLCWSWLTHSRDNPVVQTSQQEAEKTSGVMNAAEQAGTKIDVKQAESVATQIRYIYETQEKPVYIVETKAENVKQEVEKAQKRADADFSIITDANDPNKKVNIENLAEGENVTLNQYNVQAFKPVLREISYSPAERRAGIGISKRISKDGQYIGVGAEYDMDDGRVYATIKYTW